MVIMRRELQAYFTTPLAYIFIVIFLALAGSFTFFLGNFFERGQADLTSFFVFHPWLYLFLVPAIAMRLWAEERRSGTIELLMTLPTTTFAAVLGKFLAAWMTSSASSRPSGRRPVRRRRRRACIDRRGLRLCGRPW